MGVRGLLLLAVVSFAAASDCVVESCVGDDCTDRDCKSLGVGDEVKYPAAGRFQSCSG
jgi:hypothetical protein